MNRIMTTRVAALALAAPLLFTAPALADKAHGKRSGATISVQTGNGAITYSTRSNRISYAGYGYRDRAYARDRYGRPELERQAKRACRRAIAQKASYIGFRDIDFDSRGRAYQIGPRGFEVTFNEVEFEGRRRDFERPVTCIVRQGQVHRVDGIPQPGRHHRRHNGYRY